MNKPLHAVRRLLCLLLVCAGLGGGASRGMAESFLSVSPLQISVPATGALCSASISATGPWTAHSDSDWLTLSLDVSYRARISGEGNSPMKLFCLENTGEKPRTAKVTLRRDATGQSAVVTVEQAGAEKIQVLFDPNGGSDAPPPQNRGQDEPQILPASIPVREGYDFLGWAENALARRPDEPAGSVYTADGNVTLYAVWRLKSPQPALLDQTTGQEKGSVAIGWDSVAREAQYLVRVWNADTGRVALQTLTEGTSCTLTRLPKGNYVFSVRTYLDLTWSDDVDGEQGNRVLFASGGFEPAVGKTFTGTIGDLHFFAQSPKNEYWNAEDWDSGHPSGILTGGAAAAHCTALSSLGADVTPKAAMEKGCIRKTDGYLSNTSGMARLASQSAGKTIRLLTIVSDPQDTAVSWDSRASSWNRLDAALSNYQADPARYAPPIVRIDLPMKKSGQTTYAAYTHSVVVIGKLDDQTYRILDSAALSHQRLQKAETYKDCDYSLVAGESYLSFPVSVEQYAVAQ